MRDRLIQAGLLRANLSTARFASGFVIISTLTPPKDESVVSMDRTISALVITCLAISYRALHQHSQRYNTVVVQHSAAQHCTALDSGVQSCNIYSSISNPVTDRSDSQLEIKAATACFSGK